MRGFSQQRDRPGGDWPLGAEAEVGNRIVALVVVGTIAALKGGAGRPGKEKNSMFVVCAVRRAHDAVLLSESLG